MANYTYTIPANVGAGLPAGLVTELHTGQSCSIDLDGTTLQRSFRVAFTEFHSANAARASQFPAVFIGAPHPYEPTFAWVDKVSVSQMEESSPVYVVTAGYTNKRPAPFAYDSETGLEEQPFWYELNLQYSFNEQQTPVMMDIYGVPILNTAGDLFDPPQEVNTHDLIIRVSKNVPFINNLLWGVYSMPQLMSYLGTVHGAPNQGAIDNAYLGGFEITPYHGYIQDISADLKTAQFNDASVLYMDISVQVAIKRTMLIGSPPFSPGFRALILNQGFQHFEEVGSGVYDKIRATDDQGENTSDPVLLAPDGTRLPVTDYQSVDAFFLLRELYPYSNFRDLFHSIFGIAQS